MLSLNDLLLLAQDAALKMSDEVSYSAWTTAIVVVVGALSAAAGTLLTLRYTKGKEYRVALMREEAKIKDKQIEIDRLNADEITKSYEVALDRMTQESNVKIESLQKHISVLETRMEATDRKLETCEESHLECVRKSAKLEGKLEVMERSIVRLEEKTGGSGISTISVPRPDGSGIHG
jgi:hypothetical protein